ncbi:MAG: host specificity protein, partial [Pseudomonadota bacterium]
MATVILSAAGSAAGGAVGGSVLGISAGTLGRAAGAIAGSLIDNAILGQGSAPVETGRAKALRLQTSTEGAPIPRVSGRMRVSGQVIWQTRFRENVRTTTSGGKGVSSGSRQTVKEYSYSVSCAVGLCEGPIERIGRIWADGTLLDTSGLVLRIYNGDNEQQPDPKIQAVEGA